AEAPESYALIARFVDPSGGNGSYSAQVYLGDGQIVNASVSRTPGMNVETQNSGSSGSSSSPPTPQTQLITLNSVPTGGTFTLTFYGATTAPLASNATAAQVQAALNDLPTISNVTVSGDTSIGFLVTFTGQ